MKKKIIIIAVVLIIAIIAYLIYTKNAETKAQNEQLANDLDKALRASGDGYYGSVYNDDTRENPTQDPQHKLSWPKSVYENIVDSIRALFKGFTDDEEEERVKTIIKEWILTDADWKQLIHVYGVDSDGMEFVQRCMDEDISKEEINKILAANGLTLRA